MVQKIGKINRIFKIKNKTSVFNFGVDVTDFWYKDEGNSNEEYDVFSVGSDKHRDYSLLNGLNLNYKFLILTKLKVNFDLKKFSSNIWFKRGTSSY